MFTKKADAQKNELSSYSDSSNPSTLTRPYENQTSQDFKTKKAKTRITIKYDVGFNNTLFLRGNCANLNWDRGVPMKNVKADEWVWETEANINNGEFKVLINDRLYEVGPNHSIKSGSNVQYTPKF